MALNFLGLGFSFGAKTNAFKKAAKKVDTGFQAITKRVASVGPAATRAGEKVSRMFRGMTEGAKESLDDISKDINEALGDLGVGDIDLGDITSGVLEAREGFEDFGETLDDLGLLSFRDGLDEVGAGVDDLGDELGDLEDQLGDDIPDAVGGAENALGDLLTTGRDTFGSLIEHAGQLQEAFGAFVDEIKKVPGVIKQMSLDAITKGMDLLRGSLTDGINLTTSLEAEATGLNKGARALAANLGYTGKALDKAASKATSMAMSLNIGEDAAMKAVRAWDEMNAIMGEDAMAVFEQLGIEGVSDFAKLEAAGITSADNLRDNVLRMYKELGMGGEEIGKVIGSIEAMGRRTGDLNAAFSKLPDFVANMAEESALMGDAIPSEELAHLAESTAMTAAAFFELNQNGEQSVGMAMDLTKTIAKSKKQIANMFAGTEDQIAPFVKHLGIATGDVQTAFDMMQAGPAGFVEGLMSMVQQAKAAGTYTQETANFLRANLEQVVSEDTATALMNMANSADEAVLEAMASVQGATADLGELGDAAHTTGRTLDERFQRSKDSFIKNFRKISRDEAKAFVKETGAAFSQFNEKLEAIVEEGGPMAGMIKKMAEIHQLGAMSLIPEALRPMATIFGEMASAAAPTVTALGAMGINLKSMVSPAGLAIGALGGLALWFVNVRMESDSTGEALEKMWNQVVGVVEKAGEYIGEAMDFVLDKLVDWTSIFQELPMRLSVVWEQIWTSLFDSAEEELMGAKSGAKGVGVRFMELLVGEWEAVFGGGEARTRLGLVLQNLVMGLPAVFKGLAAAVEKRVDFGAVASGILGGIGAAFGKVDIGGLVDGALGAIRGVGGALRGALDKVDFGAVFEQLRATFAKVDLAAIAKGWMAYQGTFYGTIANILGGIPFDEIFRTAFAQVGSIIESAGDPQIAEGMAAMVEGIGSYVNVIGNAYLTLFEEALTFLEQLDVTESVGKILDNFASGIEAGLWALLPTFEAFSTQFPDIMGRALDIVLEVLKTLPARIGEWFGTLGEKLVPFLKELTPKFIDWAFSAWKFVFVEVPMEVLKALPDIIVGAVGLLKDTWILLKDVAIAVLEGIVVWVEDNIPLLGPVFRDAFDAIVVAAEFFEFTMEESFKIIEAAGEGLSQAFEAMFSTEWWSGLFVDVWDGIKVAWEASADALKVAWGDVSSFFEGVGDTLAWPFENADTVALGFIDTVTGIPELIVSAFEGVKDAFVSVGDALIGVGENVVVWFEDNFPNTGRVMRAVFDVVKAAWEGLVDTIDAGYDVLKSGAKAVGDITKRVLTAAWNKVGDAADSVWNATVTVATWAADAITLIWEETTSGLVTVWEGIGEAFDTVTTTIAEKSVAAFESVQDAVQQFADGIVGVGESLISAVDNYIVTPFINTVSTLATWVDTYIIGPLADRVAAGAEGLADIGTWAYDNLVKPIENKLADAKSFGLKFVEMFLEGIKENWGLITDYIKGALGDVTDYFQFSEPKEKSSPLTGFGERGRTFVRMFLEGIQEEWPTVTEWITSALQGVTDLVSSAALATTDVEEGEVAGPTGFISGVKEAIAGAVESFADGLGQMTSAAEEFKTTQIALFEDLTSTIVQTFRDSWLEILDVTALAVEAINADIETAAVSLERASIVMKAAREAQQEASLTEAQMVTPVPQRRAIGPGGVSETLVEAVDDPYWYQDYRALFLEKMNALIATVGGIGGAANQPKGGGKTKDAAAAIRARGGGGDTMGIGFTLANSGGLPLGAGG